MYKILTLNAISEAGLSKLPADKFVISDKEENPDGIILRSFDMHNMDIPETVMGIARAGAGTNNIDNVCLNYHTSWILLSLQNAIHSAPGDLSVIM